MGGLLVRLAATAAALYAAIVVVDGVDLAGLDTLSLPAPEVILTLLVVAVIFGLINAVVKPILKLTTCLINMLTLGLFTFVINAFLLWLTAYIAQELGLNFVVEVPIPALFGSLIISVVNVVLSIIIPDED